MIYGYNELQQKRSKSTGPLDFAITEFYCTLQEESKLFIKKNLSCLTDVSPGERPRRVLCRPGYSLGRIFYCSSASSTSSTKDPSCYVLEAWFNSNLILISSLKSEKISEYKLKQVNASALQNFSTVLFGFQHFYYSPADRGPLATFSFSLKWDSDPDLKISNKSKYKKYWKTGFYLNEQVYIVIIWS